MHELEDVAHDLVLIGESLRNLLHLEEFTRFMILFVLFIVVLLLTTFLVCRHVRLILVLLLLIKSDPLGNVLDRFPSLGLGAKAEVCDLINKTEASLNDLLTLLKELGDILLMARARGISVSMHNAQEGFNEQINALESQVGLD
jgi:uncharacterized SAM-binding protein YcdF (DUF218 family)